MGHYQNPFSQLQLRNNFSFPVGDEPLNHVLEAFTTGEFFNRYVSVSRIEMRMPCITQINLGRPNGVAASPKLNLPFSEPSCLLTLVQTFQGSVMPLVQSPR